MPPKEFPYVKIDDFELMKGSEGQIWELKKIDKQVFCGNNHRTLSIEGNILNKASDISGGYSFKKITRKNRAFLVQGSYTTLGIYKRDVNRKWKFR